MPCEGSAEVRVIAPPSQVVTDVEARLLEIGPHVGTAAPTEDELVTGLGVSRRSIRDAFSTLESFGVLGSEGRLTSPSPPDGGIGRLLRMQLRTVRVAAAELLAVRTELERAAAERAAAAATDAERSELRLLAEEMAHPRIPPGRFQELDAAFHLVIARASGSVLCAQIMLGLRDAVVEQMSAMFAAAPDWPGTAHKLSGEHRRLADAIDRGRGDIAAERVDAHLREFYAPPTP